MAPREQNRAVAGDKAQAMKTTLNGNRFSCRKAGKAPAKVMDTVTAADVAKMLDRYGYAEETREIIQGERLTWCAGAIVFSLDDQLMPGKNCTSSHFRNSTTTGATGITARNGRKTAIG